MNKKRVIAVHDISCIGRCSLTVALPVLSAAGVETSVIPTAVLSTHTGGFEGFTFKDLTDEIEPILNHWKTLGIKADSIYTGYVGSHRQLEILSRFTDAFRTDKTFVLVDPVMGDAGRFYTAIDDRFVDGMRNLCAKADLIVPNLTEASMLLGTPYVSDGYDESYIKETCKKLCALGPRYAVISGVSFCKGTTGAAAYDSETDTFSYYSCQQIEGFYHGSGDVFASAILGAVLNGKTVGDSLKIAVDFTLKCICRTHDYGTDTRYGLDFEQELGGYIKMLG